MTDHSAAPVILKRYGDRLYFTAAMRYVSWTELRGMADAGDAVVILDAETGADVTAALLAEGVDRSAAAERWRTTVDALEALTLEVTPEHVVEPASVGDVRRLIALRIGAAGLRPTPTSVLPNWWSRRGTTPPSTLLSTDPDRAGEPPDAEPETPAPPARPRWRDGPQRD